MKKLYEQLKILHSLCPECAAIAIADGFNRAFIYPHFNIGCFEPRKNEMLRKWKRIGNKK